MEHAKKMVLVSPEILNAVKDRPTSSESVTTGKLDDELKEILDKQNMSPYDKAQQYNQILQRYLTFYKKSVNKPLSVNVIEDKKIPNETGAQNVPVEDHPIEPALGISKLTQEQILSNFPVSLVKKGKTIMDLIDSSHGMLDWNQQGELVKEGTIIPGSHISDLVYDVVQSSGLVGGKCSWMDYQNSMYQKG